MSDPREEATAWYKRIHKATVEKLNENVRPGTRRDLSEENKAMLAQICLAIGDLSARDASKTERLNALAAKFTRFDCE